MLQCNLSHNNNGHIKTKSTYILFYNSYHNLQTKIQLLYRLCFFRFIFIALVFCLSDSEESFRTNRFCSKKISYKYSLVIFNCATERKFKVLT
jgi:hypothetical protein